MTEEIREEKHTCGCEKRELKRFLLTILGSFLGCLVALCLYGATIKPQPPIMPHPPRMEKVGFHHQFKGPQRGDFHRMKRPPEGIHKQLPPRAPEKKDIVKK